MNSLSHIRKSMIQLAVLVITLGVGVYLVGKKTNILGQAAGSSGTLALPAQVTARVNEPFTVSVILNAPGAEVTGVDVKLLFDPTLLRLSQIDPVAVVNTTLGTFAPVTSSNSFDAPKVISAANLTGTVQFSALAYNQSSAAFTAPLKSTGGIILSNLTFVPLKSGTGTVMFDFDSARPDLTTDNNIVLQGPTPADALVAVTNMAVNVTVPTPTPGQSGDLTGTLITNPGLETGSLTGWTVSGTAVSNSAANIRTGSASALLTGKSAYLSQNIAAKLTPGIPYTFTVWSRVIAAGTGWGVPVFRLSKYSDLGSADFGENKALNSTVQGWQQLKVTRTFTQADLTGAVYLGLVNFGFTGSASADDFSVTGSGNVTPITTSVPVASPTPTLKPAPTATPTPKPTQTPVPTPAPSPVPVSKTISVNASMANQDGSSFSISGIWIGTASSLSSSYLALRFTGLAIPKGAVITGSSLSVQSGSSQWIQVSSVIAAENAGNSAVFSSSALPSGRSLSANTVTYSENTQWLPNTWYNLEDVTGLVAGIISRSDWQSGNSLSLIIKGNGSAWGRKFISAAKLTITYK